MDNEVRENVIFIPLTDEVIVSKDRNEVTVDSRMPPRGYTLAGSGWEVYSEDIGYAEWDVVMTCPLDKLDISEREAYLLETFFGKADIGFAVVFDEGKKSWYMKLDFVGVGNYKKSIQRPMIMLNGTAPYPLTRFGSKVKIAGSVVKWADRHLYCDIRTKLQDKPTEKMTREEHTALGTKEWLYTDILLDIAGHERILKAYELMLRDGTLPEDECRMTIAAQKKMLEELHEELEKRREEEKDDGV